MDNTIYYNSIPDIENSNTTHTIFFKDEKKICTINYNYCKGTFLFIFSSIIVYIIFRLIYK